jgi:hypothetical protein
VWLIRCSANSNCSGGDVPGTGQPAAFWWRGCPHEDRRVAASAIKALWHRVASMNDPVVPAAPRLPAILARRIDIRNGGSKPSTARRNGVTGVGLRCRPRPRWLVAGRCGQVDVRRRSDWVRFSQAVLEHGNAALVEVRNTDVARMACHSRRPLVLTSAMGQVGRYKHGLGCPCPRILPTGKTSSDWSSCSAAHLLTRWAELLCFLVMIRALHCARRGALALVSR